MSKMLKPGDRVKWESPQGPTRGRVAQKITGTRFVQGHKAAASLADPQYLVVSEQTGKAAAHKPGALRRIRR